MEPRQKVCPLCGTAFQGGAIYCDRDGATLVAETSRDLYLGAVLLDQFVIEARIGEGASGVVYRAHQRGMDRDVAIKVLHRELSKDPEAVHRFQREAKVAASLDHPNVIRVFLYGQLADGDLYLVMEYLPGRSLAAALAEDGVFETARAARVVAQICDGVGEAHALGVVHRDVKPENVFLIPRRRDPDFVKVLDFGIARFFWGAQGDATRAGLVFGTARYISPEGAAGEKTDARSDVYSIGVLAYQLLSGVAPFEDRSTLTLLHKHIHQDPPPLRSLPAGRDVPEAIADVVHRALAKDPDARWQDAWEMGDALREASERAGIPMRAKRVRGSDRDADRWSLDPPLPTRRSRVSSVAPGPDKTAAPTLTRADAQEDPVDVLPTHKVSWSVALGAVLIAVAIAIAVYRFGGAESHPLPGPDPDAASGERDAAVAPNEDASSPVRLPAAPPRSTKNTAEASGNRGPRSHDDTTTSKRRTPHRSTAAMPAEEIDAVDQSVPPPREETPLPPPRANEDVPSPPPPWTGT